ncbi:hypothetical protein EDB81DRAFT_46979 [Dactylonectria macrodidyma]|uniref:Uncharacterized protein n=1 Tax=Dactylonectria macrodidyma TaxID=307937 RepID=A0A9P9FUD5_9HYPO|nr:hypothetical protein EDB81DRAFT_46979 [Dactylonectria macrodidyma]
MEQSLAEMNSQFSIAFSSKNENECQGHTGNASDRCGCLVLPDLTLFHIFSSQPSPSTINNDFCYHIDPFKQFIFFSFLPPVPTQSILWRLSTRRSSHSWGGSTKPPGTPTRNNQHGPPNHDIQGEMHIEDRTLPATKWLHQNSSSLQTLRYGVIFNPTDLSSTTLPCAASLISMSTSIQMQPRCHHAEPGCRRLWILSLALEDCRPRPLVRIKKAVVFTFRIAHPTKLSLLSAFETFPCIASTLRRQLSSLTP